jgi:ubinuclein
MAPRKKFEWTQEMKSLLCEVVRIKLDCYEAQKPKVQTAEEYLRNFLDAEIKPLWPQGWIQTRFVQIIGGLGSTVAF